MAYRLTTSQRDLLADCTRTALVGWALTDPIIGQQARRWEYKATTVAGFAFSRFVNMAIASIGTVYRPCSITPGVQFPLSFVETAALANDVELQMATDDQLWSAAVIACHSPYGQPEVCSRDWRTYTAMLAAFGLSIDDDRPNWREDVRDRLNAFRRAVAAGGVPAAAE